MSRVGGRAVVVLVALALTACTTATPTPSLDPQTPAPSVAGSAVSPASAAPEPGVSWVREADAPFARLEMAVTAHEGRIWLAGGLSPFGEALSDVEIYDPTSNSWSDGPPLPAGVHHAALVSDGARLLLIGGYLGSAFNRPTDIVLVLADGSEAWQPGPSLPEARAAGAAAWDGARVVYAGGVGDGIESDVYTLGGETWDAIGVMQEPREHLAAVSDLGGPHLAHGRPGRRPDLEPRNGRARRG